MAKDDSSAADSFIWESFRWWLLEASYLAGKLGKGASKYELSQTNRTSDNNGNWIANVSEVT